MTDRLANTDLRMAHIMITRGCPYSCHFCASRQKQVQYRSAQNVRKELQQMKADYGIEGFAVVDDNFTVNKKRVKEVCEEVRDLGLYWSALSRVDTVDFETLRAMRDAGCIEIKFGVETGSENLLKAMGKKISRSQIILAIETANSLGIGVKVFLIHGFPGENLTTTRETIELLEEVKGCIERVSLFRFVPLPGSYVYKNPSEFQMNIPTNAETWKDLHIYHNNRHWWGTSHDFQEMKEAYKELLEYVEMNWPEKKD